MIYQKLRGTDLKVSEIGLGTNAVGGHNLFTDLNEVDGIEMVDAALQLGITFIDTADIYGKGRSEEHIGEVLTKYNRADVVIATKGGRRWFADGSVVVDNTPQYLRNALESSLHRLKTDYVDLYYLHYPDTKTPLAEAIGELTKLKQEGKIKAIGISNVSLEQLKEANVHGDISVMQSSYHLLDRSAEERILPYTRENNISFIPYGPLAYGLLGGKYTEDFELAEGDWRRSLPLFEKETFKKNLKIVSSLKELAEEKETTVTNLSLAWLLSQEGVDAVIPGGKRKEQVTINSRTSDVTFTQKDLNIIEGIIKN
ncbi:MULTISPECIES: aldo/keto reductase [Paenibacillus]|uniref:Aryl-alcohol dehydrogenase-like predicted oxidoreductase n=1 Tax=Paenibacillus pabuli TaxID=1472 RepID=A0A855Y8C4_9BACL|nr:MULTISPECIES: aldo/keto reductase [Paenibacillus]PWW38864.1 aryl-alcohol dehydrogenase-like predicted oxidoreductase [Paenibacillus pabuli]PXW06049.1 aryl-alcohol dehydrogenase-like predicted oxidoreductase [Paenibacillus taichungensis]